MKDMRHFKLRVIGTEKCDLYLNALKHFCFTQPTHTGGYSANDHWHSHLVRKNKDLFQCRHNGKLYRYELDGYLSRKYFLYFYRLIKSLHRQGKICCGDFGYYESNDWQWTGELVIFDQFNWREPRRN